MTTITTRSGKGSPLTNNEVDANFTNLNDDKVEASGDSMTGNLSFGDNNKAIFGAGSDLSVYHDGSNSYIKEEGTGNLEIGTNGGNITLKNLANSETLALFNINSGVNLYYDNSVKLETTSTGIDVTGTVTADGLTVDAALATINAPSNNADLILTEGGTNTDARIRNSNGILEIDADLNNEFPNSSMVFAVDGTDKLKINNNGDISFYEDTGTTAKLFWDASAESLGIGTSSPSTKLHLGGTAPGDSIIRQDSTVSGTNWEIGERSAGKWQIFEDDSDSIVATFMSSGNVGIGTSSPASPTGFGTGGILHLKGSTGNDCSIVLEGLSGSGGRQEIGASGGALQFYRGAATGSMTESMRIDSSGKVGIGETLPAAALHVKTSTNTPLLLESTIGSGGYAEFQLGASGATIGYLGSAGAIVTSGAVADLAVRSQANLTFATGGSTERMRITSAGAIDVHGDSINQQTSSAWYIRNRVNGGSLNLGVETSAGALYYPITTSGTSNITVFRNATDELARFISNGNFGIGDTNPARKLTVQGGSGDTLPIRVVGGSGTTTGGIEFQDASTTADYKVQIGSIGDNLYLRAGGAERMRIDSSGNVQIGTAAVTGGRYFDIYNTGSTATDFAITRFITQQVGSSSTTSADVYKRKNGEFGFANNDTDSAAYINFKVGTSNRMRLTSSGDLLVGTTSTPTGSTGGSAFITESVGRKTLKIASTTTSGAGLAEFINPNGVVGTIVTNGSATAYNTSSDQRLKENIVDAPSASDDIDAIQVRSFDWKADGSHQKYGMVAQELQTVAPEAVTEGETEEDMMGVDYSKLVPMLVKEIQSLRARVAQLEGAD